jgi:dephospho-CoA kinase
MTISSKSEDYTLIGIGGLPRSGKDSLSALFTEAGYMMVSFGDIVREFCFERHKDKSDPISVAHMTETSNWLRKTKGADVILKEALRRYDEAVKGGASFKGLVLQSVRAPIEVDFILGRHGSLIWLEAPDTLRYKRAMQYMRKGEAKVSLEEFRAQEALQVHPQPGIPHEVQMDLTYVKEHATHTLYNDGDDIALFHAKAHELMKTL